MLQSLTLAEIDARPLRTAADLELKGAALGVTTARYLLDRPNPPRSIADAPLSSRSAIAMTILEEIYELRLRGLDDAGEEAFRRGFDRGAEAQFANPNGRVQIKVKS